MFLKLYGIAFLIFLAIDAIWLTVIARKLYQREIGYIMTDSPNFYAAGLFYLLFIAGLVFFVIEPAINKEQLLFALAAGLFFGLVTYATYDLTNLATLEGWPLKVTIIDLIWGSSLGATVSVLTYLIYRAI